MTDVNLNRNGTLLTNIVDNGFNITVIDIPAINQTPVDTYKQSIENNNNEATLNNNAEIGGSVSCSKQVMALCHCYFSCHISHTQKQKKI